jgi:hypothetical protein
MQISDGLKKDLENKKEWSDLTIYLENQSSNRLRKIIKFTTEEIQKRQKRERGQL